MATTNYTGKLVDLLIFRGAAAEGEKQVALTLNNYVTTGIQKLLQSFAVLFLTERGSVTHYPDLGTDFVTAVRQGSIRDEADVQDQFLVAAEYVRQTLSLEAEQHEMPTDEQFLSAALKSFEIDRTSSTLRMYVVVTSVAGQAREIFLPVPLAIQ